MGGPIYPFRPEEADNRPSSPLAANWPKVVVRAPYLFSLPPINMETKKIHFGAGFQEARRPEFAFRVNGISVSGFGNQADDGREFFRFAVQRSYRDAEGTFQATSSFDLADLPVLAKLLDRQKIDFAPRPFSSCRPISIHSPLKICGAATIISSRSFSLTSVAAGRGPIFQSACLTGMGGLPVGIVVQAPNDRGEEPARKGELRY